MTYCVSLLSAALVYLPAIGGQAATDAAEPSKPNPFEQALSRAAAEHKYLVLAVFGDECEGCRVGGHRLRPCACHSAPLSMHR